MRTWLIHMLGGVTRAELQKQHMHDMRYLDEKRRLAFSWAGATRRLQNQPQHLLQLASIAREVAAGELVV